MEYERKVRKQIYLDPEQNRYVKQISARNGMSEAEFIREAVDNYLANNQMKQKDPLFELVGIVKNGKKDGSTTHDQDVYLAEKGDTDEKK
ncbi:CopG family transcriptional regulator [Lentibacillus sp. CBA3610]|uniref:ribbon-helix-helix domain-containing protein n=1 Tax=Lentibacillus sp. CBA3610 TaxID=2518176 RepID=UPI0015959ED8|nr:CopG family transcriptional regulator [Lentibacillus sp. CBA3610]QKY71017.1 ribbon-helix-helix protein, CopG family [Lentibacillus sp. CBA3610]